jgi:hypothetical protein
LFNRSISLFISIFIISTNLCKSKFICASDIPTTNTSCGKVVCRFLKNSSNHSFKPLKIITFKHNPFKRLTIESLISSILFSQLNGRIIVFLGEINIFDILCKE